MDILWSLGLLMFLLLALNHMAGGRPSNVLRPVAGIASGVVSLAVRLCMSGVGAVARLLGVSLGGSLKLPQAGSKTNRESGPTPPRWDE
ncbi:MAG: hypothetical protein K2X27_06090 [Candidatus Obscuribacterales bacterium]|nr:hypothetical protein [Candidatus Obscuribacterales bacterium]